MMFLIDTNVLILGLAGQKPESIVLKQLIEDNQIVFSPVVIAEFLSKAEKKEQKLLVKLISQFTILSIDETIAKIAADYRREFARKKKTAYLLDCFIAAACIEHGVSLLTNDLKDFPMKDIAIYTPQELVHKIID